MATADAAHLCDARALGDLFRAGRGDARRVVCGRGRRQTSRRHATVVMWEMEGPTILANTFVNTIPTTWEIVA
jgi:hypothetical protein